MKVLRVIMMGAFISGVTVVSYMYAMENLSKSGRIFFGEYEGKDPSRDLLNNALFEAVRYENVLSVTSLLHKRADVNALDTSENVTPLSLALTRGVADIVQLLLDAQANIEQVDVNGHTPLVAACFDDRENISVIRTLLDHNANFEVKTASCGDMTPLLIAITCNYADTVRLLLDRNADSSVVLKKGMIGPLKMAVGMGNSLIVQMLLDVGAEYGVPDEEGMRLWDQAKPKIQKMVVKAEKERIQMHVAEQDWLPEELLSCVFLNDIKSLKQIVCDYACCDFCDEEKNQIITQQIVCNKRKRMSLCQKLVEQCKVLIKKCCKKKAD